MTLRSSDIQSDSDLDSIRNSCDVSIWKLTWLTSSRSQTASTVSRNGQQLHIIGGRSHLKSSLGSLQSVGLQEPSEEKQISVEHKKLTSRFASAVTLSNGDLVITGGKMCPRDAFLISGFNLTNWSRLPQMNHGRYAHSSCSLTQDNQEIVIVAGGWSSQGEAQSSVEMYSFSKQLWTRCSSLPSPRVYFSLQVKKVLAVLRNLSNFLQVTNVVIQAIGGYYKKETKKVFPGLATLERKNKLLEVMWSEEKNVDDTQRQRSGFMTAQVPVPWLTCIKK